LRGGYHVNACIHPLDAALRIAGQRPVSATGCSRIGRPDPHGDSHDVFRPIFEFENGILLSLSVELIPPRTPVPPLANVMAPASRIPPFAQSLLTA
jgi:predicted dehydrogenase